VTARAPHTRPAAWPEPRPGRLATRIEREHAAGARCGLLGLPDDLGIVLNGGRPGAAHAPSAFRAMLARFGVAWDGLREHALSLPIYDAGDVEPAAGNDEAALLETHARVLRAVDWLHEQGMLPVCLGGGHDLSLPSITALARRQGRAVGGINLDAHLDVRERVGSGMPFRRLIEAGDLDPRRFVELGLGRFVNDVGDLAFARERGATLVFAEPLLTQGIDVARWLELAAGSGPAFLSIDLDGLDQSVAPGVSAPNPLGICLRDATALAEAAGAHPAIGHFDLMEGNPNFDLDGRTSRAAVLLFLHFVTGLQARPA
jgi:formimidoylglutamase